MSFRIVVATSDGVNIDQHFGRADEFHIFDVESDGNYRSIKIVSAPKNSSTAELKPVNSGNVGCAQGEGCGGGGCHGSGSFSFDAGIFGDAKYVLAAKVGKGIERALLKNNIIAFSVETTIDEAIRKIVIYENRLNKFK